MTATLHILARGARDLFELVPIILFVVISIVVGIIRKSAAQKAEQARRSGAEQPPKQPDRAARQAGHARSGQTGQAHPQPGRTTRPPGPPPAPPPIGLDVELAQQALRAMGLIPAGPQPSEAGQPVVLTPVEPASIRVEEELKLQRRRQRDLEAQRRKRLASRKVPEADSAAIEGRILQVRPDQEAAHDLPTGPAVNLSSAERARRAIIFHEIFSAPKALRQGKEMWDV